MKKYLIKLANGSMTYGYSQESYRIGQFFGWIGVVISVEENDFN